MKKITKKLVAINFFGTLGYLFLLFSWLLFLGVLLLLAWQGSTIDVSYQLAHPDSTGLSVVDQSSTLLTGVGYGITVLMILVSVVVLVALPYFIGKLGGRAVRKLMNWLKIAESRRHLFLVKCSVAALPLLGFFIVALIAPPLDMTVPAAHITTITSSVLAMICFLVQLFLARRFAVAPDKTW